MKIGLHGGSLVVMGQSVAEMVEHARTAEAEGFDSYWLPQLQIPDALTAFGPIGSATSTIELGTAVIPTWVRHPLMLAAQALTVQEIIGNRLALGIGLAHRTIVEDNLGMAFAKPAKHMEEYLAVLLPALRERAVDVDGEFWSGHVEPMPGLTAATPPGVLIAAMGPRMLRLAAERTDGVVLWLSGPRAIADHVVPSLTAARPADAPPARVVASVPVCVTSDADGVRGMIAMLLAGYNDLPSYRGVMDLEGAAGPADVSIVGDEDAVRAEIERYAEAGVTDFAPVEFVLDPESAARTRALLRSVIDGS